MLASLCQSCSLAPLSFLVFASIAKYLNNTFNINYVIKYMSIVHQASAIIAVGFILLLPCPPQIEKAQNK